MSNPNQIQDGTDQPFFNGQFVTPEILNKFVNFATLKKGAISEQPVYDSAQEGAYSYATGETVLIQKIAHGLSNGSRIKATFTAGTGASGAVFDGYYEVQNATADSFRITVVGNEEASGGTVTFNRVPSGSDEVLVHDVGDVDETKPKKITVDELLNSKTEVKAVSAEIGLITGRNGKDLIISPEDGPIVTGATYNSTDGFSVVVTKANHGLIPQVNVVALTCTDNASPTKGQNYSGVFIVEAATSNTFTCVLKQEQFQTLNEFQENEVDAPIISTGTATYRRVGSVENQGNVVVQGEIFANGPTNLRDNLYVYGKARFGEFVLPKGRVGARPTNPEEGQLFYNKDDDIIEIWRKSQAFPQGTWETFDKVSSQIIIPAQYTATEPRGDRIALTRGQWFSKTIWALPVAIPYKQYEIQFPPVRLNHYNVNNDGQVWGKLELIAKKQNDPSAVEYVIAGYYGAVPSSTPFGVAHNGITVIPPWTRVLTPDDIDMSDKALTLRVSVNCRQGGTNALININDFSDSNRICSFKGYFRITPMVRKGGTHIPTPWKSKVQTNSLSDILPLEREALRYLSDPTAPFPDGAVCPIMQITAQPFNSGYQNQSDFRPISAF